MILEITAACLPVFCARTMPVLCPPLSNGRHCCQYSSMNFSAMSWIFSSSGAPVVVAFQHAEVGQGEQQGELVAGDELPLGQQPLDVPRNRTCSSGVGGAQVMAAPSPVPGLVGDDPSDTATGIGNVAVTPGNDVDVGVQDGLACRFAIVQADVEAIGVKSSWSRCRASATSCHRAAWSSAESS